MSILRKRKLEKKKRKKMNPRSLKMMMKMMRLILRILPKKMQIKRPKMPRKRQRPRLKKNRRLSLRSQHPSQLPSSKKLSFQHLMAEAKFNLQVMMLSKATSSRPLKSWMRMIHLNLRLLQL